MLMLRESGDHGNVNGPSALTEIDRSDCGDPFSHAQPCVSQMYVKYE
jgi:hypothetical protein